MQIRAIRHTRKTYACMACEKAPITTDREKHGQPQRAGHAWLRHTFERLSSANSFEDYEALLP